MFMSKRGAFLSGRLIILYDLIVCNFLLKYCNSLSYLPMRAIRTIKAMNTIVGFSLIGMLKICTALIKEKDTASLMININQKT